MDPKKSIRTKIKRERLLLSSELKHHAAIAAWIQVIHEDFFQKVEKIAFYLAVHGELDPKPIMQTAWRYGKQTYLPVLNAQKDSLSFYRYEPKMKMTQNKYGIWEPPLNTVEHLSPEALDLVFVPLVAFDLKGNRIGMGKGYYDRTFAFRTQQHNPLLVGLAYEFQKVDSISTQETDIPLNIIVTNQKIYHA